jgi:hypothetical protein
MLFFANARGRGDRSELAIMAENAGPTEVLFEFHRVGNSLRVAAIDPVSNFEVTIVAPVRCGERELQRVALQKLAHVRGKRARAEREIARREGTSARAGSN